MNTNNSHPAKSASLADFAGKSQDNTHEGECDGQVL